jgi:hypothetical protein
MEYKEKKINKRVPLVLTYHPSLEKISGIVRHHWKEIEKSETLCKSPSLCLVVSTVEHIRFTLMAWLNGILLKQCLG